MGREPTAPGKRPSSMIVKMGAAMTSFNLPTRNDARRKTESPETASKKLSSNSPAAAASKTIGTSCVVVLRAPSLRKARRAASWPISSGESSLLSQRCRSPQPPTCICSPSRAIGATIRPQFVPRYWPAKPELVTSNMRPNVVEQRAPSEFVMRGSKLRAASSLAFAISILRSVGNAAMASSKSCKSASVSPVKSAREGNTAASSTEVNRAISTASATSFSIEFGCVSEVEAEACRPS